MALDTGICQGELPRTVPIDRSRIRLDQLGSISPAPTNVIFAMPSDDTERQRRLAEALRANLRRRKGQARERTEGDADPVKPEPEDQTG
jgi:hypothetical protein